MLRGQEGAQPGPYHPWYDKHVVHDSMFVTCNDAAPYCYRHTFFLTGNKPVGGFRKNSEQSSEMVGKIVTRTNDNTSSTFNNFSTFEWAATGERNFDAQMRTECTLLVS
jgi:hypothetical protein